MTYANDHGDRRRYGRRVDEPCGSWRRYPVDIASEVRADTPHRLVCTRPHHPGDDFHMTADRRWWWNSRDSGALPASTPPEEGRAAQLLANPWSRANHGRNLPMPTVTVSVAFDKPVYAPGETIKCTITVDAPDPDPQEHTVSGKLALPDGRTLTFTGTGTIDSAAPTIRSATISDGGGLTWTSPVITGNTVTCQAVA